MAAAWLRSQLSDGSMQAAGQQVCPLGPGPSLPSRHSGGRFARVGALHTDSAPAGFAIQHWPTMGRQSSLAAVLLLFVALQVGKAHSVLAKMPL